MDKIRILLAIIVSATVVFASLSPVMAHSPRAQVAAFNGSSSIQECNDRGVGNSSGHASCRNSQNQCDTNNTLQSKSGSHDIDNCSSRIFFQDDFSGSSIDSNKWNASIATSGVRWCSSTIANHEDNPGTWLNPSIIPCQGVMQSPPWGSVTVTGGSATLSSNFGRTFPYIWAGPQSRAAPFPASGNFTLDVNMTYKALGGSGDGFFVTRWDNTNPVGNNPPGGQQRVFLIWADSTGLFVQLLGMSARVVNELGTHHYALQYGNGKYTIFVDHVAVLGPVESTTVPNTIWLGNPVFTFWGAGLWSSFSLSSVRVTGSQIEDHKPRNYPIDQELWTKFQVGTGASATLSDGRLVITLTPNSTDNPLLAIFGAGVTSTCLLTGNFDIQVHFQLLNWPFSNGVRVGLGGHLGQFLSSNFGISTPNAVERTSFGSPPSSDFPGQPREVYLTDFVDRVHSTSQTADLQGTLRFARVGTMETGYYLNSGNWTAIHTGLGIQTDIPFTITAWSHNYAFQRQLVKVSFDDFRINTGQLVC